MTKEKNAHKCLQLFVPNEGAAAAAATRMTSAGPI